MKEIREIKLCELDLVQAVAKECFDKMISPHYSEQGKEEFNKMIEKEELLLRYENGSRFIVCTKNNKVIGFIEIVDTNYIGLFFVKVDEQGKGNGRRLIEEVRKEYEKIFVFSASPYSEKVYEKMGLERICDEQEINGIKFTIYKS